jgi:hypothetical protein
MHDETAAARPSRYLVRIAARDEQALRSVLKRGLDVTSVEEAQAGAFRVRGIVTLEAIGRLVNDGFEVLVNGPVQASSPIETTTFEEWSTAMMADLDAQLRER